MRETKTITTPVGKHEVVINTFITGREKRKLENAFLEGKPDINMESQQISGIDYSVIDKAQDIAWLTVIVSFDGKKNGEKYTVDGVEQTFSIVDAVLDLRLEDHKFIVGAVNDVMKDKDFTEKKTI